VYLHRLRATGRDPPGDRRLIPMPVIRILYITAVTATVILRVVIFVRSWQIHRREGEEGLRADDKRNAVERMTKQIRGGY
jgi:hypothetical protein